MFLQFLIANPINSEPREELAIMCYICAAHCEGIAKGTTGEYHTALELCATKCKECATEVSKENLTACKKACLECIKYCTTALKKQPGHDRLFMCLDTCEACAKKASELIKDTE